MSDQNTPVEICTDATAGIAMLSCVLPNSRGLMRNTCSGLTTIRVGKKKFPRVKRLAVKLSALDVASAMCLLFLISGIDAALAKCQMLSADFYTHSRAPFFQIQM